MVVSESRVRDSHIVLLMMELRIAGEEEVGYLEGDGLVEKKGDLVRLGEAEEVYGKEEEEEEEVHGMEAEEVYEKEEEEEVDGREEEEEVYHLQLGGEGLSEFREPISPFLSAY